MFNTRKRASDAATAATPASAVAQNPYLAAQATRDFGEELRDCHDGLRLWRHCRNKPCKRARRCRGDVDQCTRAFPPIAVLLQETAKAERAGLSPLDAVRAAVRTVFGGPPAP